MSEKEKLIISAEDLARELGIPQSPGEPETLLRKWAKLIGRHEPFATAKFCAEDLKRAADRIDVLLDKEEHYRGLIKSVLRNEPSDMVDGITMLEMWRKDAAALLKE